jgi:hypothetical protein
MTPVPQVNPTASKLDPTKVKTIFALLAVFLIVFEALLLFWFSRAESTTERVIAGSLMTVVLIGFLIIAGMMIRRGIVASQPLTAVPSALPGGNVQPAVQSVTAQELEVLQVDPGAIAGPDGDFVINRPPPDWIVTQSSVGEVFAENFGIKDQLAKAQLAEVLGNAPTLEAIALTIASPRTIEVIPVPGISLVNGEPALSALPLVAQVRLVIQALPRALPPQFIPISLEQRLLIAIVALLNLSTLRELNRGTTRGGAPFVFSAFEQRVDQAIVAGVPERHINLHTTCIAIEGDVQDHFLMMQHYSADALGSAQIENDLRVLKTITDSFRPLTLLDRDQASLALRDERNALFQYWKQTAGESAFYAEFSIILFRVKDLDLHDAKERADVLRLLHPFEKLAEAWGVEDEELDELWEALHQADAGDVDDLEQLLAEIAEEVIGDDEEDGPALPPPPPPSFPPPSEISPPASPPV